LQLSNGPVPYNMMILLPFGNNVSIQYKYKYCHLGKEGSRDLRPLGGLRVLKKIG